MKTLWLAMLAAVLQAALVCPAQKSVTAASLSGQVMDSAGAVIPGADVQALAVATGQSRTTKTDERGRFRLSYLPLGAYKISARAHGFARVEQRVELSVGSAFEIAVRLPVAGREEEVVVTAAVPVIEESRSQISETVMDAESTQLPFPGRNTLDLALLLPAYRQRIRAVRRRWRRLRRWWGKGTRSTARGTFRTTLSWMGSRITTMPQALQEACWGWMLFGNFRW